MTSDKMKSKLAPEIPEIPQEAIGFAKAVGELAAQHEIREATLSIRMDTGYLSSLHGRNVQETLTVHLSRKDGRGRPRMKLHVSAEIHVSTAVMDEQDSTN